MEPLAAVDPTCPGFNDSPCYGGWIKGSFKRWEVVREDEHTTHIRPRYYCNPCPTCRAGKDHLHRYLRLTFPRKYRETCRQLGVEPIDEPCARTPHPDAEVV